MLFRTSEDIAVDIIAEKRKRAMRTNVFRCIVPAADHNCRLVRGIQMLVMAVAHTATSNSVVGMPNIENRITYRGNMPTKSATALVICETYGCQ